MITLRSTANFMRIATCLLCAYLPLTLPDHSQGNEPVPADRAAFTAARGLSDPQAKIDALRRFIAKYPKSSRVNEANGLILETLVKKLPTRTAELNTQVNTMLKHAKGEFRMYDYDNVASTLADGGVLLARAEQISEKSLKMLNKRSYTTGVRKAYIKAKLKPPNDAVLEQEYKTAHSSLQATLGRIFVKEGKTAEGESQLKAAYADNPDNSAASGALGMLAARAGNDDLALTYLTRARLTGKLDDSQQKQLETLYAEKHGGSNDGLEIYLDERYATLFRAPFIPAKYQATGKPSDRTVLAELFTGAGCDPCAGADLAMDAELERYSRKELAVLELDQHIPEPDPLANPDSVKRFDFYHAEGTPTLAIDGTTKTIFGNRYSAKNEFDEIDKQVQTALQSPAEGAIRLTAWRAGDRVQVHTSVTSIKSTSKTLKLQIALVEGSLRYSGENGIRFHHMVVRSIAGNAEGFTIEPGKDCDTAYTFDIPKISERLKTYLDGYEKANDQFGPITFIRKMYAIDQSNLSVVAFVQDETTKHILQAAYAPVADKQ